LSERPTERSFYAPLSRILERFGIKVGQEISITYHRTLYPDLEIFINDEKVVIEVKINSNIKLVEAIIEAHEKQRIAEAEGFIAILLPREVREIDPKVLSDIAPKIEINQAIILLPWLSDRWERITFLEFAKKLRETYETYLKTKLPTTNFDVIVRVARDVINDLAITLRRFLLGRLEILNMALQIIGRFDIYKAMLEEFNVSENEMKAWIADIMAYIFVNQILFYHIISKKLNLTPLPKVIHPFMPQKNLLDQLYILFNKVSDKYPRILGMASHIIEILKKIRNPTIDIIITKFISAIYALRPENVEEEVLGRLYQESIPPETRKNLGAFYTNPVAARILASLAVDSWDEKIIDPACGSGTLLVESYKAKLRLSPSNVSRDELHRKFLAKDIYGIDIMHFATHLASINLSAQNIRIAIDPNIYAGDGIEKLVSCSLNGESDPPMITTIPEWLEYISTEKMKLPCNYFDVVIMNPPFTRRERIPERERKKLDVWFSGIITGKTGYWAYFVAGADNVLRQNGKLALVAPEEFLLVHRWRV